MPRRFLFCRVKLIELGKDPGQRGIARLMVDEILQEIVTGSRRSVLPMRFGDREQSCHENGVGRAFRLLQNRGKYLDCFSAMISRRLDPATQETPLFPFRRGHRLD